MKRKTRWIVAGGIVAAVVAGGGAFAVASVVGSEAPLTEPALSKAVEAALAHTGGGTVVETETGDDGSAYGVEIRLDDGSTVEVSLDASFKVIGQSADDVGPGDRDGESDDGS